jgi:type IV pilus assembly protein PilM
LPKGLTETVRQLFRPQLPLWACEFTPQHVIVAGVNAKRNGIHNKAAADMPAGTFTASLAEPNIQDGGRLGSLVQDVLKSASFKGSEIGVVIPDEASRISFVNADKLPKTLEEQQTFLRWKLKKTVPFDVDTAQIAFQVVGAHNGANGRIAGYDIVVAMSPRSIVEEYEALMEALDIHAGFVIPSTLAALNLMTVPAEDSLFVKVAPDCVTTTVFQDKRMKFYRRVADLGLFESVYPTVLYYQDKLSGSTIKQMTVCTYDVEMRTQISELQEKLGIPALSLEPRNVDDIFKPVLGAVHLSWANLI